MAIKLLKATRGQWLYRNMLVHDTVSGLKAAESKEELQREIEDQIELGGSGLDMVRYGIALLHMPGSVGGFSMEHIVWDKGSRFYKLGQSMDNIG